MSAVNSTQTHQPAAMMTAKEAHDALGQLCASSFYNAIRRGDIPSVRIGKRILIPRDRFADWLSGKK